MEYVICIAIFAILFVVIDQSLKAGLSYDGNSRLVLSVSVALLCMVGMKDMLLSTGSVEVDVMLLPYAALGVAILAVILMAGICTLLRRRRDRSSDAEMFRNRRKTSMENQNDKRDEHDKRIRVHHPK